MKVEEKVKNVVYNQVFQESVLKLVGKISPIIISVGCVYTIFNTIKILNKFRKQRIVEKAVDKILILSSGKDYRSKDYFNKKIQGLNPDLRLIPTENDGLEDYVKAENDALEKFIKMAKRLQENCDGVRVFFVLHKSKIYKIIVSFGILIAIIFICRNRRGIWESFIKLLKYFGLIKSQKPHSNWLKNESERKKNSDSTEAVEISNSEEVNTAELKRLLKHPKSAEELADYRFGAPSNANGTNDPIFVLNEKSTSDFELEETDDYEDYDDETIELSEEQENHFIKIIKDFDSNDLD